MIFVLIKETIYRDYLQKLINKYNIYFCPPKCTHLKIEKQKRKYGEILIIEIQTNKQTKLELYGNEIYVNTEQSSKQTTWIGMV